MVVVDMSTARSEYVEYMAVEDFDYAYPPVELQKRHLAAVS